MSGTCDAIIKPRTLQHSPPIYIVETATRLCGCFRAMHTRFIMLAKLPLLKLRCWHPLGGAQALASHASYLSRCFFRACRNNQDPRQGSPGQNWIQGPYRLMYTQLLQSELALLPHLRLCSMAEEHTRPTQSLRAKSTWPYQHDTQKVLSSAAKPLNNFTFKRCTSNVCKRLTASIQVRSPSSDFDISTCQAKFYMLSSSYKDRGEEQTCIQEGLGRQTPPLRFATVPVRFHQEKPTASAGHNLRQMLVTGTLP